MTELLSKKNAAVKERLSTITHAIECERFVNEILERYSIVLSRLKTVKKSLKNFIGLDDRDILIRRWAEYTYWVSEFAAALIEINILKSPPDQEYYSFKRDCKNLPIPELKMQVDNFISQLKCDRRNIEFRANEKKLELRKRELERAKKHDRFLYQNFKDSLKSTRAQINENASDFPQKIKGLEIELSADTKRRMPRPPRGSRSLPKQGKFVT